MASNGEIKFPSETFSTSGPQHLIGVDWVDTCHRISVVASLVKGVSVLEGDRHGRSPTLAPPWWNSFHFQLIDKLEDEEDQSIFGAIYEFKPPESNHYNSAPKYVVCFRGTRLRGKTWYKDLKVDIRIFLGTPHESSRFKQAMEYVKNKVNSVGAENIWLAGHCLGAAIAMLVGKEMAKENHFVETFLFNPPNIPGPSEWLENPDVQYVVRFTSIVIKAGLAFTLKGLQAQDDQFEALSGWTPFLFVNKADRTCSKYILDFKFEEKMEEFGLGKVWSFGLLNPMKNLFFQALKMDSKPFHVIPSAYLNINSRDLKKAHGIRQRWSSLKEAHGIQQWWSSDLECQTLLYQFGPKTTI
ncbi:hypothetical protein L1049_001641 [Liquidambar formosana]|uniref:Fungal lipase-like domain-containing protein n=1 Tax=Liquidambar formosana TaxID=63359 RepID=A0AAP0QZL0_LIQFO